MFPVKSILNLSPNALNQQLAEVGVFDIPPAARDYLLRLLSTEGPITPWQIRERAREIAIMAFQCSTPEGRLALSRTLSESDQGAIALHAYVDGPAWLTTDLVEEIQQAGMVPVFIVQPKVGRLRLITASSGCPGMSPRSIVEPLSRCAILPDLSCD